MQNSITTTRKTKKILIVEDELIPAYDLSDNIERLGYIVTGIADTAEEAFEHIQQHPPDLILLDIQLRGEMTGIDLANKIRSYNIPIIYLTAFSDEKTLSEAGLTAPYGYITKPPRLDDLRTMIAIALIKHQETLQKQETLLEEQRLNELKTRFLAMIAHDLRTPLTSMLMSVEMLQYYDQKLTEAKKGKHFDRIKTAIQLMQNQLEELMAVHQAESGKLPLNPSSVDVIAFSQKLLDDFQEKAIKENCEFRFQEEGAKTNLNLDETLLFHILSNLLSNAIKYSKGNGIVTLLVKFFPNSVSFSISDQGIGMPPEYLDKLFSPFERAKNAKNIKGTGIGLYIVKQAVERHQGFISVESEENKGTTFTVTLPSLT